MILTVATSIFLVVVPENVYSVIYLRYFFGSILILWLPGYSLIKALFPAKMSSGRIEATVLMILMSLVLVSVVGFLLNYSPWGINIISVTLSLSSLTIMLLTIGTIREYCAKVTEARKQIL
jgi:uncharacterized membrane protein